MRSQTACPSPSAPCGASGRARSRAFVPALALAFAVAPLAGGAQSADHDALRRLKTVDWPRAYWTQDVALLDRILADDFRVIQGDGSWSTKREELAWVRNNGPSADSMVFVIKRLDVERHGRRRRYGARLHARGRWRQRDGVPVDERAAQAA
jgi:hypothetical protein